jgi:hypothetical protein
MSALVDFCSLGFDGICQSGAADAQTSRPSIEIVQTRTFLPGVWPERRESVRSSAA